MRPFRLAGLCFALLVWLRFSTPSPVLAQDDKGWLYAQINALRGSLGLRGYTLDSALGAAAQAHSEWMAATGQIAHTQDNGSTPESRAAAFGYSGVGVSENIYGGMNASAAQAWGWWIGSSVHYGSITHPDKTEVGIGIAEADGLRYFTLLFGQGASGGISLPTRTPAPVSEAIESAPPPAVPAPVVAAPLITFTPSPTIPSPTPTLTWTPTATWTPSPTATSPPPTSTPLVLAAAPSASPFPSLTPIAVALAPLTDTLPPAEEAKGLGWRPVLLALLGLQIVGVAGVAWRLLAARKTAP